MERAIYLNDGNDARHFTGKRTKLFDLEDNFDVTDVVLRALKMIGVRKEDIDLSKTKDSGSMYPSMRFIDWGDKWKQLIIM